MADIAKSMQAKLQNAFEAKRTEYQAALKQQRQLEYEVKKMSTQISQFENLSEDPANDPELQQLKDLKKQKESGVAEAKTKVVQLEAHLRKCAAIRTRRSFVMQSDEFKGMFNPVDWQWVKVGRQAAQDASTVPLHEAMTSLSNAMKNVMLTRGSDEDKERAELGTSVWQKELDTTVFGAFENSFIKAFTSEEWPAYIAAASCVRGVGRVSGDGSVSESAKSALNFYKGLDSELQTLTPVDEGTVAYLAVNEVCENLKSHCKVGGHIVFHDPRSMSPEEWQAIEFAKRGAALGIAANAQFAKPKSFGCETPRDVADLGDFSDDGVCSVPGTRGTLFKFQLTKAWEITEKSLYKHEKEIVTPTFSVFEITARYPFAGSTNPDVVELKQLSDEKILSLLEDSVQK